MELFSRRYNISPLIIAVIFITFFHNVLSRHKIRHFKDRFKRQQGANLYLPGSFVTDNNDAEAGPWEEWSAPSPCSRTCGGGVSTQTRKCAEGYDCSGPSTRHFSCNTQDCPDATDYRAQQCAEHNNVLFEGVYYEWIPYTKGSNPCELHCMPKGERFYFRHADAVVDGTRCTDEGYDVCVQGKCQPVGCDRMLGSNTKEDRCRVCGGDDSTCNTFSNTIQIKDMQVGYNDILLIPAGATNIRIEELAPSDNYLGVRNTSGYWYLNGNWRIDFPRSTDFAGTRFKYERTPQESDAPDIITSLGPTDESLYIVLLYPGTVQVPVSYSYSLPTMVPLPPNETYSWIYDEFTPCTVPCGKGSQDRNVSCAERNSLQPASESLCDSNSKPVSSRVCNDVDCAANWIPQDWGNCSVPCGKDGGVKKRQLVCQKVTADGEQKEVDVKECPKENKPEDEKPCNVDTLCPKWYLEPWKPCDHLCGDGKQTRRSVCYVEEKENRKKILPNSECEKVLEKPETEKPCNLRPCEGVDWITSEWSGCAACGLTQETRKVLCATENEKVQSDELCNPDRKPETTRECASNPCLYLWYAGQWSECSVTCGQGVQSRVIFCGISTANGVQKADDSKCDQSKHFETIRNCTGEQEACDGEWFSGPMGQCSRPCGGGQRSRKVVCIKDFQVVDPSACGSDKIVFSEEKCNEEPCSEDTLMPTDITHPVDESEPTKEYSGKREVTTTPLTTNSEDTIVFDSTTASSPASDSEEYEIVPDSSCEDGEWVEENEESQEEKIQDDEDKMQGDDPFAYENLMMGDQPFEGSGETTYSTDTSYSTETSTFTETTDSTYSTEYTATTEDYTGTTTSPESTSAFTGSTESSVSTEESTDVTTKFTDSMESLGTTSKSTGSTLPNIVVESNAGEPTTSTNLPTIRSTDSTESSTEFTGSTEPSISTAEFTGSTESSVSTSEFTGSTESSVSTTEFTGSTESSVSTSEFTGSTESSISTTEFTGSTESSISTTEFTGSTESSIGTTEFTGSTESSISTNEFTGSTESSVSTSEFTGSTESSVSTTEFTGSTESSISTAEFTSSTEPSVSTTEFTVSTESSASTFTETTYSTNSTEYTATTEDYTGTTTSPESTSAFTGSTESSVSTEESTDVTTKFTDSMESLDTTSKSTGSTLPNIVLESNAGEPTTSTNLVPTVMSSTGYIRSTDSTESSTEFTGSTEPAVSTTEITGSTDSSASTTEFTGSTEPSVSTTEFTGSTETSISTTEFTGSTESSISTTEFTGSTEPSVSTTEYTGSTESSVNTTEFTGSAESSVSTTEFTGSTEPSVSTTEFTGSTEASVSTTEFTGSTESSASTTEFTGSTESSISTTEFTGSTESSVSTSEFTGSTETSESTTEFTGSTESTTEFTENTESTTEFTGSTESTTEFTGSTENTTEFTGTTESTTEFTGSTESTTEFTGTTESTTEFTGSTETTTSILEIFSIKPRLCKRRKIKQCKKSEYGCCWDNITPAEGPFDKGCPTPHTCKESKFGCCEDGVSAALGSKFAGCPRYYCNETLFGCCPDNKTSSQGNDNEGCPPLCLSSKYGCCNDNTTEADGPHHKGCPEDTTTLELTTESTPEPTVSSLSTSETTAESGSTESSISTESSLSTEPVSTTEVSTETTTAENCNATPFRCCPDGITTATGPGFQGCGLPCSDSTFGCCQDAKTPAHGPSGEGCCLSSRYGCCPNDITPARGPNKEGCECQVSPYGCCPDNQTSAQGYDNEGCGCQFTPSGCCPDDITPATGANYAGCLCHTFQFGCCPDGVTTAEGPRNQGCGCLNTEFGCCSDEKTPASGPNGERCTCENTKFGCCTDGVTEAKGENYEGCIDIPQNLQEGCRMPKERGGCRNYTVKWFFDLDYGGCSRFWYGGCDGNENRYKSKEECEDICVQPRGTDRCKLPKISGPCEGYYLQYYYDNNLRTCSQFVYGGCLGNNNRFETKDECMNTCAKDSNPDPCQQRKESGPCKGTYQRYYYDKDVAECQEFTYGGCKGNDNNFDTLESCKQQCAPVGERKDLCSLPKSEGNCTDVLATWYYDTSRKNCAPFYYTGCYGNLNNFQTKEACQSNCPSEVEKSVCHLPADIGECSNYVTRWYFDTKVKTCRQFYYGSCGGNGNNFATEQLCQESCQRREELTTLTPVPQPATPPSFTTDMCLLANDPGPCLASIRKYYYDSRDGSCKEFIYGGCLGNGNNFDSIEQCLGYCGSTQDQCSLPPDRGPCGGDYLVYYYDRSTDSCQQFRYGGCSGNSNMFRDQQTCESACKKIPEPPPTYTQAPTAASDALMCFQPPDHGNCTDRFTAFYYDSNRQTCVPFVYTGCGGNSNRFNSEEQCQRQCGTFKDQDVCNLQKDPGPCRGQFVKYYYDRSTGRCEQFAYGGCQGNGNRFSSEEECAHICITHEEAKPNVSASVLCRLPVDQGSCNVYQHKRWYFNDSKGECIAFIYSGCGGNFNNFKSYQYCLDYCKELLFIPEPQPISTKMPEHPCQEAFDECTTLRCAYGVEPFVDENECNRCRCRDPCVEVECLPDEQCAIDINRNKTSALDADFIAICRKQNKPGTCPRFDIGNGQCEEECRSDADCALQMKCCPTRCGTACVDPPAELVTQEPPSEFQPPHIDPVEYKPEISAAIGDQATLRCAVSGNPNPRIRWSKENIEIDGTQPRYRIKLDQSLQIITLHKTDSGIYLCTASNGVGGSITNQVKLEVIESEPRPVTMLSEAGDQPVVVSLNDPTTLNCMVLGYPFPTVTWWQEDSLIPFKNSEYEISKDYSLLIHSVKLKNLGIYTCQAYNGFGKAASWSVTVKARGPVHFSNNDDLKYSKWIINDEEENSPATTTTTKAPITLMTPPYNWDIPDTHTYTEPSNEISPNTLPDATAGRAPPIVTVPVRANITSNDQKYPVGTYIEIPCEFGGYPPPQVQWYKDGVALYDTDKIRISETDRSSLLTIERAVKADSGSYQCEATNVYSQASSTLEISIEGMYIHPSCTDNQFLANCSLIVEAKYCKHKYYSKFCCRSCTEAGFLAVDGPHIRKMKRHNVIENNLV